MPGLPGLAAGPGFAPCSAVVPACASAPPDWPAAPASCVCGWPWGEVAWALCAAPTPSRASTRAPAPVTANIETMTTATSAIRLPVEPLRLRSSTFVSLLGMVGGPDRDHRAERTRAPERYYGLGTERRESPEQLFELPELAGRRPPPAQQVGEPMHSCKGRARFRSCSSRPSRKRGVNPPEPGSSARYALCVSLRDKGRNSQ